MVFRYRGEAYDFSRADVEARMRGIAPDRITTYFMVIGGYHYPVKQVARTCMGVYDQQSRDSRRFLISAGFTIHRLD
ncbi:hypothetical protein [Yinghuangia soli]|uniref:Uncharacterized protein n=1 Tax=Yinghuangia soli TaxID=2908204 RepID=A0AA41Q797_9ACTN|nr:hypothetical protein [Yinghuangia soli]MCF2532011.1 hypothetical protein [Yinghuangia soli]